MNNLSKKKIILIRISIIASILCLSFLMFHNIANVAADDFDPTPKTPNENFSWNFTEGDLFGYEQEFYINNSQFLAELFTAVGGLLVINVSEFVYDSFGGNDYYFVRTNFAAYNASTKKMVNMPDSTQNMSLINFTNNEMYFNSYQITAPMVMQIDPLSFFIPKNGTELALEWCASALNESTYKEFFGKTSIKTDSATNEITYSNSTTDSYIYLKYDDNGVLEIAEFFYEKMIVSTGQEANATIKYIRTSDYNPINEIEWGIDVGDNFLYKIGGSIMKFEIVDFINSTFETPYIITSTEVRADAWELNSSLEWDLLYENGTIGGGNDYYPFPYTYFEQVLVLPNDTKSNKNFEMMINQFLLFPEIKIISEGNSVKIINTSTGGYFMSSNSTDGVITYIQSEGFTSLPPFWGTNLTLLGRNVDSFNAANIDGEGEFYMTNIGKDTKFDVNFNISVLKSSKLIYSGSVENPTSANLNDILLFLDLELNETENLNEINISIECNGENFVDIDLWWYNQSANDGFGAWESVSYIKTADNIISFSVDHLSVFALTGNLDSTPPIISIDNPLSTTYATDTITVSLSGDAENYWYYIEGIDINNQTWTDDEIRYGFSDDTYTLHAYGNDSAGNIGEASVMFTIDTTPPMISIDEPALGTYNINTINVSLSSEFGDATDYWYYIEDVDSTNRTWTETESRTLPDGNYTLYAYCEDNVGNMDWESVTFTIDTSQGNGGTPEIPFGNFYLIFSMLGVGIILILIRRNKFKYKF